MILQRKQKQVVTDAIERRLKMAQVSGGRKLEAENSPARTEVPAKLYVVKQPVATGPFNSYVAYLPDEVEDPEAAPKLWPEGLQMGAYKAPCRVLQMKPRPVTRTEWNFSLKALLAPLQSISRPMLAWLRPA